MFTGIIEKTCPISSMTRTAGGARLELRGAGLWDDLIIGESVAVDGVCLTVIECARGAVAFSVSRESLERSICRQYRPGVIVNLERALTPSGRLGGHIVQGHVDGMTEVAAVTPSGDHWVFSFQLAPFFGDLIVEKGSITVNGISLTVARLAPHRFDAAVLAFTRDHTSLRLLSAGDKVNIELDIIGKYVQRMLRSEAYSKGGGAGGKRQEDTSSELTREKLGTLGFL